MITLCVTLKALIKAMMLKKSLILEITIITLVNIRSSDDLAEDGQVFPRVKTLLYGVMG